MDELQEIANIGAAFLWALAIMLWCLVMTVIWAFVKGSRGTPTKPTFVKPVRNPMLAVPVNATVIELRNVITNVRYPINE